VIFGRWVVCFTRCAHYIHHSEPKTWMDSSKKSKKENSIGSLASNINEIWVKSNNFVIFLLGTQMNCRASWRVCWESPLLNGQVASRYWTIQRFREWILMMLKDRIINEKWITIIIMLTIMKVTLNYWIQSCCLRISTSSKGNYQNQIITRNQHRLMTYSIITNKIRTKMILKHNNLIRKQIG